MRAGGREPGREMQTPGSTGKGCVLQEVFLGLSWALGVQSEPGNQRTSPGRGHRGQGRSRSGWDAPMAGW